MSLRRKIALWLCPELGDREGFGGLVARQSLANARAAYQAASREVARLGDIGANHTSHGLASSLNSFVGPGEPK